MKKNLLLFAALTALSATSLAAIPARKNAPAAAPRYSSSSTPIGTLLDDPRTRAIVDRHIPNTSTDSRIFLARGLTLKGIQRFSQGKISDRQLAAIDKDLAKFR